MRARFINEGISDVLKPKSGNEIFGQFGTMDPNEILKIAFNDNMHDGIKFALQNEGTYLFSNIDIDDLTFYKLNDIQLFKPVGINGNTIYMEKVWPSKQNFKLNIEQFLKAYHTVSDHDFNRLKKVIAQINKLLKAKQFMPAKKEFKKEDLLNYMSPEKKLDYGIEKGDVKIIEDAIKSGAQFNIYSLTNKIKTDEVLKMLLKYLKGENLIDLARSLATTDGNIDIFKEILNMIENVKEFILIVHNTTNAEKLKIILADPKINKIPDTKSQGTYSWMGSKYHLLRGSVTKSNWNNKSEKHIPDETQLHILLQDPRFSKLVDLKILEDARMPIQAFKELESFYKGNINAEDLHKFRDVQIVDFLIKKYNLKDKINQNHIDKAMEHENQELVKYYSNFPTINLRQLTPYQRSKFGIKLRK